jgi:ketosteroid isomerase-like protein
MEDSSALGLCIRYRDAFVARDTDAVMALVTPDFVFENVTAGERVEDGIDLILISDGRICRNAVYSNGHTARVVEAP